MSDLLVQSLQPEPSQAGCQFETESGAKCGLTKILARSYCAKHYRQLARSGVFTTLNKDRNESDLVAHNSERLILARDLLEQSAPRFARLLIKSAKVAAEKGDHRPALAGLLHTKTIDPVLNSSQLSPNSAQKNHSGVTIKIGVALSGQHTTQPTEITINSAEDDDVQEGAIVDSPKA